VTHGPGYQSSMVIPYSYGMQCANEKPGKALTIEEMAEVNCTHRRDCDMVNGDALLMAGYLCHWCLPDVCSLTDQYCENIADLTNVTGLNPAKASLKCHDFPTPAPTPVPTTQVPDRSVVGVLTVEAEAETPLASLEEVVAIAAARAYDVERARVSILRSAGRRAQGTAVFEVRYRVAGATEAVPGGVTAHFDAVAAELGVVATVLDEEVELMCEGDVPCEDEENASTFPTSTLIGVVAGLAAFLGLCALVRCARMKRPQMDEVKPAQQEVKPALQEVRAAP